MTTPDKTEGAQDVSLIRPISKRPSGADCERLQTMAETPRCCHSARTPRSRPQNLRGAAAMAVDLDISRKPHALEAARRPQPRSDPPDGHRDSGDGHHFPEESLSKPFS
jgi:hypothetical protein